MAEQLGPAPELQQASFLVAEVEQTPPCPCQVVIQGCECCLVRLAPLQLPPPLLVLLGVRVDHVAVHPLQDRQVAALLHTPPFTITLGIAGTALRIDQLMH